MTAYDHPLFDQQLALEEEMRSLGIERFQRMVEESRSTGTETRIPTVRRFLSEAHRDVVEGIEEFKALTAAGNSSRWGVAYHVIKDVDVDLLAHLSLRSVLDSLSARSPLTKAALHVGTLIEDELHYRAYREQDERGYKKALQKAEKSASDAYKRRHLRETARKREVQFNDWPKQDRIRVGTKMIEIIVEKTALVEVVTVSRGAADTIQVVQATPKTIEWLEKEGRTLQLLSPTYMPTIVPPKPWTENEAGGYYTRRVRRLKLVKTTLKTTQSPQVLAAVNAVQDTPWRINAKVLDVMEEMYARGITMSIVPSPDKLDIPARPVWLTSDMRKEEMTEEQLAEFKMWKRLTAQVHEENAATTLRRLTFLRSLDVARKFRDYEAIYFPHTLDFRGRMYPVPLYLHPQGNDTSRGLLTFSKAEPIGNEEGVTWLAAHGAGCWGVDKVSFPERLQWVRDHEQDILAVAEDPLDNLFWAQAEKPWSALAFCYEWAGYVREGLSYHSHLPVQMDGSCNGLQHFSAMLRDPVGGKAVNLIPSDKPSDIYQMVADVVIKLVERDAMSDDEEVSKLAKGWLGNVTRKVTKRPVMTLAYGAKRYGYSQMVFDDTVGPWKAEKPDTFPWEGNGWMAAQYMAGLIWEAVGSVVVAARDAMEWLQECTKVASEHAPEVEWVTPDGFMAKQKYTVPNMKRLELTFLKARLRLSVDTGDEKKLDKRKQASGIAPNFVHSLDAAHLRRTVIAAAQHGIGAFSLIHDSYGAHACNCGLLAKLLREEFFLMYSEHDVLAEFKGRLEASLPEGVKLPAIPKKGNLNLYQVLESAFFFA